MCFAAIGGIFLAGGAAAPGAAALGATIVGGVVSTGMTIMQTIQQQKTASVMAKAETNRAITNKQKPPKAKTS